MAREYLIQTTANLNLKAKDFKQIMYFVREYNLAKEKVGPISNEDMIIEQIALSGKYTKEQAKAFIRNVKALFMVAEVPAKEDEVLLLDSYQKYITKRYNAQREKVIASQSRADEKKFTTPEDSHLGGPFSSRELNERGRKAKNDLSKSRFAKWALIIGMAVLGSFAIGALATAIFSWTAGSTIVSMSTLSALTWGSSLVGTVLGGLLGNRIYNAKGRGAVYKQNKELVKMFKECGKEIEEDLNSLGNENEALNDLVRDFDLVQNASGDYYSQTLDSLYDEFKVASYTTRVESASPETVDEHEVDAEVIDEHEKTTAEPAPEASAEEKLTPEEKIAEEVTDAIIETVDKIIPGESIVEEEEETPEIFELFEEDPEEAVEPESVVDGVLPAPSTEVVVETGEEETEEEGEEVYHADGIEEEFDDEDEGEIKEIVVDLIDDEEDFLEEDVETKSYDYDEEGKDETSIITGSGKITKEPEGTHGHVFEGYEETDPLYEEDADSKEPARDPIFRGKSHGDGFASPELLEGEAGDEGYGDEEAVYEAEGEDDLDEMTEPLTEEKKKKASATLRSYITKKINSTEASAVGRYILIDLREGVNERVATCDDLTELEALVADIKTECADIENGYRKFNSSKTKNDKSKKYSLHLSVRSEDDMEKGEKADDTALPKYFTPSAEGKTYETALKQSYIKQLTKMQEVYLKNEGASQETIFGEQRKLIKEISEKYGLSVHEGEIDFAGIEQMMLEIQGKLEEKIGKQTLNKLTPTESQAGEDE